MASALGRLLLAAGLSLAALGALLLLLSRVGGLGRLPLDFRLQRGPVTIYLPLGTALLVSLLATLVLNLVLRLRR